MIVSRKEHSQNALLMKDLNFTLNIHRCKYKLESK